LSGLLYLSRADVSALLPDVTEQLDLVEATYRSLAAGRVELPPKPGVHPRKDSFLHAMPAYLRDEDVVALKWVGGYPANKQRGLPYITGLVVVNSGAWEQGLKGAALTRTAFADIPTAGPFVLTIGLLTFVFSTILGWSYYGEKAAEYLFGEGVVKPYRVMWVIAVMIGSVSSLPAAWSTDRPLVRTSTVVADGAHPGGNTLGAAVTKAFCWELSVRARVRSARKSPRPSMISKAGWTATIAARACSGVTPGPCSGTPTVRHSSFSKPGAISSS